MQMGEKRSERRGMLLLLACTLLWSISGVMIKRIPWNAAAIAGARSLIAGGVMALYLRVSGVAFRVNRTSVASGVIMSGMFLCFTLANKLTTAANAIVMQSSAPAFVLIYDVTVGKKRVRRIDVLAVLLTLAGITLFFVDKLDPGGMLGNVIALVSGLLLALTYIITCGAKQEDCMSGIMIAHIVTAVIGLPSVFTQDAPVALAAIGGVVLLGVLQLGIPYILYGLAVRHCPPLACSLIGMLEAVFNPTWVFLFSGEAPSLIALLGGVLVLASIAGWAVQTRRMERRGMAPEKAV